VALSTTATTPVSSVTQPLDHTATDLTSVSEPQTVPPSTQPIIDHSHDTTTATMNPLHVADGLV
ncbi:MAG TPA: hypothetical protein VK850_19465, partial [Candidatus Binatia bacterium]|nr:hypothetical protein [Candidatus Binatia bacterium]